MKNKMVSGMMASVLAIALLGATVVGVAADDGETVKLTASSCNTAGHPHHESYYLPVLDAVKEASDGKIDFDLFIGGELVPTGQELEALQTGTIDVAVTLVPHADTAHFPMASFVALPSYNSSCATYTYAYNELMKKEDTLGDTGETFYDFFFTDNGIVAFSQPSTDIYTLDFASDSVDALDDFNAAVRMRTNTRVAELFCQNINCTPISMPLGDVYDAMSRGAVEGMFMCPQWSDYSLDQVIKTCLTGVNAGPALNLFAMTIDKFNELPEDVQEAFRTAAEEKLPDGIAATEALSESEYANLEEKGAKLIDVSEMPEDVQEMFDNALAQTWLDWIDEQEAAGMPGKALAILWRDCLINQGAELPEEIMNL